MKRGTAGEAGREKEIILGNKNEKKEWMLRTLAPPYTDFSAFPFLLLLPLRSPAARCGGRQRETQAARWWKAEARDGAAARGSGHRGQGSWPRLGVLQRENERSSQQRSSQQRSSREQRSSQPRSNRRHSLTGNMCMLARAADDTRRAVGGRSQEEQLTDAAWRFVPRAIVYRRRVTG